MRERRFLVVFLATAILAVFSTRNAKAQIAVWPGSVVAPFVHVEWNGRWVHVCAPFVNLTVDVPRCCGCQTACCDTYNPRATSNGANGNLYAHPTWRQLARSASKLSDALDRLETADSWRDYLAVGRGKILSSVASNRLSNVDSSNDDLVRLLRRFDEVNRQRQYLQVAGLPEFQQTHTLLANYLAQQPLSRELKSGSSNLIQVTATAKDDITPAAGAIDIARTEVIANPVSATAVEPEPEAAHASVEELPPPAAKSGI